MAIVRCKGTALSQMAPSTLYVPMAQCISLDLPDVAEETFEADTLDNTAAGIPHKSTGRVEGGSAGFELFLDPVLESHTEFLAKLTTPLAIGSEESYKFVFADTGTTEWLFTGAGISIGGTVALGDGLKMTGTIKLDGIPTFP